jgi:hypothetical protein
LTILEFQEQINKIPIPEPSKLLASPIPFQCYAVILIEDYRWKESNSSFIISLIPVDKLIVISAIIIKKYFK